MFPWFAAGHITPYIHLSNKLAERGYKITFLLPKKAQTQFQHLNLHPNLITFHPLIVPHVDGLPPGTETASEIPFSSNHLLASAMDLTREQVYGILSSKKPDFVFYDFACWMPEITKELGIKSISYSVVSASATAISTVPACKLSMSMTEEELMLPPAGYPSTSVLLRGHETHTLLLMLQPFGEGLTFHKRIQNTMKESDAIAIRTSREIEGKFCDYISHQFEKPVLLTGPVFPENGTTKPLEDRYANFLERFPPESLVFCAFGSQITLSKTKFQQVLLGFELTGLPFFIALKPPLGCKTVEEGFPVGFEERVSRRGLVCGDWVPQPLILAHPSVGCFVNHCGFGSMWESLMSDCQIVLIPELGDQIINTRLLTKELKVAIEVEREKDDWVSKERLSKAILSVMDKDSEVGVIVKKNHAKLKEILASSGWMDSYVDKFIQDLQELVQG